MNFKLLLLLTLSLASCGGELVDTDGIQNAAVKASENIKEALSGDQYQTSTISRPNVSASRPQKVFEANIDSLKTVKITITNPKENIGLNGITGRVDHLATQRFGNNLSWESLGLVVAYEGSELLVNPETVKESRNHLTGAIEQIIVEYEVDGNTEDILTILIGNDFNGRKLANIKRVLIADLKIQIKSKTNLNQNRKQNGGHYENFNF